MKIDAEEVRSFSLDRLRPYARDNPEFDGAAGTEHYRLLAYLSTFFRGQTLVDIFERRRK